MIYNNLVFMADARYRRCGGWRAGTNYLDQCRADTAAALFVGGAALLYEDPLARDPDRVLSETAE